MPKRPENASTPHKSKSKVPGKGNPAKPAAAPQTSHAGPAKAAVPEASPEFLAFKALVEKHKIALALLRDSHYISRLHPEARKAFEQLVEHYDTGLIQSIQPITNQNRRDIILRDILNKLKSE